MNELRPCPRCNGKPMGEQWYSTVVDSLVLEIRCPDCGLVASERESAYALNLMLAKNEISVKKYESLMNALVERTQKKVIGKWNDQEWREAYGNA